MDCAESSLAGPGSLGFIVHEKRRPLLKTQAPELEAIPFAADRLVMGGLITLKLLYCSVPILSLDFLGTVCVYRRRPSLTAPRM